MSYGTNNRGGGYGGSNHHSAKSFQATRSKRAQSMDSLRTSKRIAKTEDQWLKDPSHYDLPGVDTKKDTEAPPKTKGSVDGSTATYNEATGWMAISFSGIPAPEIRTEMKASGFRYNPRRKQWIAKWYPDREALAKKLAGEIQQVKIEPNWAAKAEHAAALSEKHAEKADKLHDKAHRLSDSIPFGQPVLPNHHSTQGHLNDLSKIDKWHRQGVDETEIANNYAKQAERYGRKATGESLKTIGNRIKKLEAERRSIKRSLIGDIVEIGGKLYRRKGSQPSPEREAELKSWLSRTESRLAVEKERYVAGGGILDEPAKH